MNKVILMGRLTRDPDVRYSSGSNSTAIARFAVAVDRRGQKDRNGNSIADFFNCTAFGKQAEFAEKYLAKGMKILLIGRIQNDNYTNRDGQKVNATQIITEEIEFAESKGAAQNGSGYAPARPAPAPTPSAAGDGFMNIPEGVTDDELPFN